MEVSRTFYSLPEYLYILKLIRRLYLAISSHHLSIDERATLTYIFLVLYRIIRQFDSLSEKPGSDAGIGNKVINNKNIIFFKPVLKWGVMRNVLSSCSLLSPNKIEPKKLLANPRKVFIFWVVLALKLSSFHKINSSENDLKLV